MTDTSDIEMRTYLRQTGNGDGALELVIPTVEKGLRTMLKARKAPTAKKVGDGKTAVILGAGVAGLTLAFELLSHTAYKVVILEANDHVGGRSLTLRPGDSFTEYTNKVTQTCKFNPTGVTGEPYLNAGPGRIPSAHRNVLNYCKALNVDLEVYVMESRSNLMRPIKGFTKKRPVDRQLANDPRGYFAAYLFKNSKAFLKFMEGESNKAFTTKEEENLKKWLTQFGALDKEGNYVGSSRSGYVGLPGTVAGQIEPPLAFKDMLASLFWELSFYQPEDFLWQQTSFQPIGGMDKIVNALLSSVKEKGAKVVLNAPVSELHRKGERWRIAYGKGKAIMADTVISNIPIPLLQGKVKEQDFDADYWRALSNVFNTKGFLRPTCKVGWQSDRKYWQNPPDENSVPIFGGISRIAPNKMQQMWYPSNDYHDQTGILTGAYNYGDKASAWGRELPKTRMAEARDGAEQLHGKPFAKQLKNGLSIAWQNMQYQQGGWVDWNALSPKAKTKKERTAVEAEMVIYDRVRSLLTQEEPEEGCATWCYNQLQKEDNGFFVTGDQVSQLPGWQEGAMASALQIFGMMAHPKHIQPLKLYRVPNVRALVEAG